MPETELPVTVTATRYTVSCVPDTVAQHYLWALTVEHRGKGTWAVMEGPFALGADGEFDYEPSPSSRDDAWLATHRFDLDTALSLAREHAPAVNINGLLPADVIARHVAPSVPDGETRDA